MHACTGRPRPRGGKSCRDYFRLFSKNFCIPDRSRGASAATPPRTPRPVPARRVRFPRDAKCPTPTDESHDDDVAKEGVDAEGGCASSVASGGNGTSCEGDVAASAASSTVSATCEAHGSWVGARLPIGCAPASAPASGAFGATAILRASAPIAAAMPKHGEPSGSDPGGSSMASRLSSRRLERSLRRMQQTTGDEPAVATAPPAPPPALLEDQDVLSA